MPRRTFMSWRVNRNEETDTSNDAELQTVAMVRVEDGTGAVDFARRWVTVARGDKEIMHDLANELNRSRFELFDLVVPEAIPGSVIQTWRKPRRRRAKH